MASGGSPTRWTSRSRSPPDSIQLASKGTSASAHLQAKELHEAFRQRLDPIEREIARRRSDEETWEQIAGALGDGPEALRKMWERARNRVVAELAID